MVIAAALAAVIFPAMTSDRSHSNCMKTLLCIISVTGKRSSYSNRAWNVLAHALLG